MFRKLRLFGVVAHIYMRRIYRFLSQQLQKQHRMLTVINEMYKNDGISRDRKKVKKKKTFYFSM